MYFFTKFFTKAFLFSFSLYKMLLIFLIFISIAQCAQELSDIEKIEQAYDCGRFFISCVLHVYVGPKNFKKN